MRLGGNRPQRPGISRRRLIAAGGTLAGGLAVAANAACSSAGNSAATVTRATTAVTGAALPQAPPSTATVRAVTAAAAPTLTPKRGGTLLTAQVTDLNLNTGYPFAILSQNATLHAAVHEPLIRYRASLTPEPVIAERFELNIDRTMATVTIRQGITFHNGAPVTPEDVFFSLDAVLDPVKAGITGGNFQVINFVKMIIDRKKVDSRTMQFSFDQPRVNIADLFAQLEIVHAASFPSLLKGQQVIGTGPFAFKTWNPNQGYHLEANKSWWGTSQWGGPYLDAIDVKIFADYNAIALAYASGDLDIVTIPIASASAAAPYRDKGQTTTGHKVGLNYVGAVVTNPVLKDPRVRQALFLALDRDRFIKEVSEGFGTVTCQPWPTSSPAFDPALETTRYDPNTARDLLKQAGFTQDRPLALEYSTPAADAQAAVVKENFEAVGVKITLKPQDGNAVSARFTSRLFPDLFISAHSFADLSPLTNFQQTFPYRIPNIGYYDSPTYDDIIAKLEKLDPLGDEAKVQYKRFNQLWGADDPWMFPMSPTVGGIELANPTKVHGQVYLLTIANVHDFALIWKS